MYHYKIHQVIPSSGVLLEVTKSSSSLKVSRAGSKSVVIVTHVHSPSATERSFNGSNQLLISFFLSFFAVQPASEE